VAKPPLTVPIAGFRHYPGGRKLLLGETPLGSSLALVREPDNKHDHLAVQVLFDGLMLGYVPRTDNLEVAWALDGKLAVKAVFAGFRPDGEPAMQIVWE
jgi:hypothetical protein